MSGAADFFKKLLKSTPKLKKEIVQQILAVEADNFHKENFQKKGFTDSGFTAWGPRKKTEKKSRSLLVKSGNLKREATHGKIKNSSVDYVISPYGEVHNTGGRAGRGEGFQMTKRQFIGESKLLKKRFKDKSTKLINKRLNKL